MPFRTSIRLCMFALAVGFPRARSNAQDDFSSVLQPALVAHCVKCHGKGIKVNGKVNLLNLKSSSDLMRQPNLLDAMITALEDQQMPPENKPPLEAKTRQSMIRFLKALLKRSLAAKIFAPTPIRRMNRFQYNNAVVDLLELERSIFPLPEKLMRRYMDYFHPESRKMPPEVRVASRPLGKDVDGARAEGFIGVAAFPQDLRAEHGYDNRADHLTLSPLLMESFLRLSHTIVESRDLKPEECRSWNRFFTPPPASHGNGEAPSMESQVQVIRARLTEFLRRAFRRPVDQETLDRFVTFAENNLKSGVGFTDTMKTVVGATIASPDFLYLYNTHDNTRLNTSQHVEGTDQAPEAPQRLDDFELASRLSFFLWGSIPDDTLLDLAEAGKLSDAETLNAQLDRMLNDRRMVRFCDSFPGQWLQLDRLISSIPDPMKFEYFYFNQAYRASMHMMLEPLLLFETLYLEDRSIMELLDPEFTWQSELLASAYQGNSNAGSKEVKILTFKRVSVTDSRWGGVITNAAVMTMTSSPTRTQPITRGAWVNTVIFNDPPDPPPADVPPLPEPDEERLKILTLRDRFEEHRKREDCASCHQHIDPLGFALENYGPTGVWRDKYENGRWVNPRGTLFNQHEFNTAIEFKQGILKEKRRFIRGFAAHLLSYALGRELNVADSPALNDITESAMAGEDRMRTMLKRIALSEPFRQKNIRSSLAGKVKHAK